MRSRSSPASPVRRNGRFTTIEGATVTYANPAFPNPLGASYGSRASCRATSNAFVPVVNDPGPFPGSNLDTNAVKPPYNFDENPANPTLNLTFASQPLSFMGQNIEKIIETDQNPTADLLDVQHDIKIIASLRPGGQLGLVSAGLQRQRCA